MWSGYHAIGETFWLIRPRQAGTSCWRKQPHSTGLSYWPLRSCPITYSCWGARRSNWLPLKSSACSKGSLPTGQKTTLKASAAGTGANGPRCGPRARGNHQAVHRARLPGKIGQADGYSPAFLQLRVFVTGKAKCAGILVFRVDSRGTSRTDLVRGHAEKTNRAAQARFFDVARGFAGSADQSGAVNPLIGARAEASANSWLELRPSTVTGHPC